MQKKLKKEEKLLKSKERLKNVPLGTGTLKQAATAIRKRKKKNEDMRKALGF